MKVGSRGAGARLAATVLAVGLAAPWLGGAARAEAVPPGTSIRYATAGTYSYVVPPGVTRLLVDASGAQGQSSLFFPGNAGGKGGRVVATVLVTPGETLTVVVGGRGVHSGGYNGGGAPRAYYAGFGGGGATDLRRGSSPSNRLVVAGGGGGAGPGQYGGAGGEGGGTPGGPGVSGSGGGPGTLAAGGVGGTSVEPDCSMCSNYHGQDGSFAQGGAGGFGYYFGGGGGGGGWYGGGGGAGAEFATHYEATSSTAGGGGGSSYVAPVGAVVLSMSTGLQYGDGQMTITVDPSADDAPSVSLVSPANGAAFGVGAPQVFTVSATDPDGDQWVARIEILDSLGVPTVLFTMPASSGQTASATPPGRLPPGDYTWTAVAVDSRGASSPPAPARTFSVAEQSFIGTGGLVFKGTATLPTFPCSPPPPFGTGPCSGSFTGDWSGTMSGTSGRSSYTVDWAAPLGRLNASFQYAEWQCLGGAETVLGLAIGTGAAEALPGEVQGKWHVPGESFPRDIIRLTATFTFNWVRAGISAVLVLEPVNLSAEVAGLGMQSIVTEQQVGVAAFVAAHSSSPGGVPTCAQPLSAVEGHIAGTVPLVQAIM